MSDRKTAVVVGVLFFVQMITFMIGSSQVQLFLDGEANKTALNFGVLMEMVSGIAIVVIGLLMYRILKRVDKKLALGYPIFRLIEFTVSAILGFYLLSKLHEYPNHLLWVYLPTAIGGLILTYLLYVSKLVPRAIALLGLIGYALLFVGVLLDLLGVLEMDKGLGLLLLAPGGLFEFLFLPIWLIFKGFNASEIETKKPSTA
jgi:hypothetical protein